MKRLLVMTAISMAIVGCGPNAVESPNVNDAWTHHGESVATKIIEVEGHKYLVTRDDYNGYFNIVSPIHAASCPCMNK